MSKSKTSIILLVVFSVALAGSRVVSGSNQVTKPATKSNYTPAAVDLALNKAASRGRGLRTLSLNVGRRGHSATALPDGRVLIAGGENENGPVAEVEAIDSNSSRVDVVATLVTARGGHTATVLQDGRVIIIGGSSQSSALRSSEIFDPLAGSISPGPRLNVGRSGHSATLLGDGQLLVAGGAKDASAEIFNPNSGRFTVLIGHLLEARPHHGAALLTDGTVLIAGGLGKEGKPLDSAEVFNPVNSRFEPIVGWMGAKRINPEINQLPDGKVQIIGGDEAGTMEMYSPEGRFFRSKASLTLTAEMLPAEALLLAKTRSAYLDGLYSSKKQSKPGPEVQTQTNQPPLDLHGYSATETAGRDFAVIAGGVDARGQIVRSVLVTENTSHAAVTTDRIDYWPQESPVIAGSGWTPGERILLVRQQSIKPFGRTILRGKADASGHFSNSELTPADHQVGSYILTALGEQSGFVAQTTYRTAPVLDPKVQYPDKPTRITFEIPLNGKPGSMETEVGTLEWKPKASEAPMALESIEEEGEMPLPISATGCLSIPGFENQLCGDVTVTVDKGDFEFNISAKGEFTFDKGEGERLPSLQLGFEITVAFETALKFRISGKGSAGAGYTFSFFPAIEFNIGELLNCELTAGLKIGVSLDMISETTFVVEFNASQSRTLGVNLSTETGLEIINRNNHEPDAPGTGSVNVEKVGETCLTFFLGPSVGVELSALGENFGGGIDGIVDAFFRACVKPTVNETCDKTEITLEAGIEASLSANLALEPLFSWSDSLPVELLLVPIYRQTLVNLDESDPIFLVSDVRDTTDEAGGCSKQLIFPDEQVARDTCSGIASIDCQPPSGTFFPTGVTTVHCTATDRNANSVSTSFTVTIKDDVKPVFAQVTNQSAETDPGKCSAQVPYILPQATDNCPGVTLACQPPSGSTFEKGVTTVNCTATDASQNVTRASFTVAVNDTEKPKVTAPNVLVFAVPGTLSTVVNLNAVVTDNCPGVNVLLQPPSGSVFPGGSTLVTGTATDAAGNISEFSFMVTVYNIIAVDESTGAILRAGWNGGPTAQYEYYDCRKGLITAGTMSMTIDSCKIEGRDLGSDPKESDRNVFILFNRCTFRADASIEFGGTRRDFTDLDVRNSPFACP